MNGEYISLETAKIMSDMEKDNDELYERIFDLKDKLYMVEDKLEAIIQNLLHSHITLEEIEKIGDLIYE